jgi:hypothetical protein
VITLTLAIIVLAVGKGLDGAWQGISKWRRISSAMSGYRLWVLGGELGGFQWINQKSTIGNHQSSIDYGKGAVWLFGLNDD